MPDEAHSTERSLACFPQALVPAAVEREIAFDETGEFRTSDKTKRFPSITHPTMEFGANQIKIPSGGAAFAFTYAVGVLAAQPGLDA